MPLFNPLAFSALVTDQLDTGEETLPRAFCTNGAGVVPVSQQIRFVYFTARKSETTTQVRVYSGTTAAAATPSLCRIGLYSIDAAGAGSLVASTANDTTLFAATTTAYTKSWSAPYAKQAGQRYAFGVLVVSATTMPNFPGQSMALSAEATPIAPTIAAALSAQADLPNSFTFASLVASGQRIYAAILP